MNDAQAARELIAAAKDLTAKAPQMGKGRPVWKDIRNGQRFKYKGKWYIKKSKTKAMPDVEPLIIHKNEFYWG